MNALTLILAQADAPSAGLNAAGAIIMTASIAGVLGLSVFCISHILRAKRPSGPGHAPPDVDAKGDDA